jgi:hypothetical protein
MQNPYNSALIDEIHNHFPAILYDSGRFATIYDLLQYVRQQMAARYDTYTSRRNAYMRSNPRQQQQRPQRQQRHERQRHERQRHEPPMSSWRTTMQGTIPQPILPTPVMTPQQNTWDTSAQNYLMDPVTQLLFRTILTPVGTNVTTPATMPFWDSVPVAPTSQQIEAASQAYAAPNNLDTPCAICQDTIRESDMIRRLSYCNHFFHRTCVDTWFQRNVHCPVCRHDIRQRQRQQQQSPGMPVPYVAPRDE